MISYYHVSLESGGGVGVQIRKTAEYLRKAGIEVDLFDPWKPFSISDYDIYHFFPAHPYFELFARRMLKPMGANVVVSPVFWPEYPTLMEAIWTRVSGMLPLIDSGRSLMKKIMHSADLLLPNSVAEAHQIHRIFGVPHKQMRPVPNGTDLSFKYAKPDKYESLYSHKNFTLYVGNIGSERKNHLRLLQAWEGMDRDLLLVGNVLKTAYSDQVMQTVGRNDRVHYLGFIDKDDPLLASLYAACEVFILPGVCETPGLAALEAGIAGAKVAVTTGGSTRDYFGNFADYIDPTSPSSIRKAVLSAYSRPKDNRLREHVENHFSWEHVALATLSAYNEVLAR